MRDYDLLAPLVRMETQSFDAYRLYSKGTMDPIKQAVFQMSGGDPTMTIDEIQAELDREGY